MTPTVITDRGTLPLADGRTIGARADATATGAGIDGTAFTLKADGVVLARSSTAALSDGAVLELVEHVADAPADIAEATDPG
jgi:hypothetical protein